MHVQGTAVKLQACSSRARLLPRLTAAAPACAGAAHGSADGAAGNTSDSSGSGSPAGLLEALQGLLADKASQAEVQALALVLGGKADKALAEQLGREVAGKADRAALERLQVCGGGRKGMACCAGTVLLQGRGCMTAAVSMCDCVAHGMTA